jgi:leucyl/phenylalanyl-tRNA--protein transferase
MRTFLKNTSFHFTINQAFAAVLEKCSLTPRAGQDGTWLNAALQTSLIELHQQGWAHSAEVWQQNELVGGLYGIRVGSVFCGESMFSLASNASKFALIKYTDLLKSQGVKLIDCQVYSEHLASLGARMMNRKDFMNYFRAAD